jgi:predicted phosphoribosyltransferase
VRNARLHGAAVSASADRTVVELPHLRDRVPVFADRADAGMVLADMLREYRRREAMVLAIPAGGVPVAAVVARHLRLPLDVAVVSKITLPWNTEAGYGAVAFDGTVRLNESMLVHARLSDADIQRGIAETAEKVATRAQALRGDRPPLVVAGQIVILIDDGLASGFTMRVAVEAVQKADAGRTVVAVPTGHDASVQALQEQVDAVYCANIRGGWHFAVAEAYERWYDVSLDEARRILTEFR